MYKLYDKNGIEVKQNDLQDKGLWCQTGLSKEQVFVNLYGKHLSLKMNPDKEENPYVPDLINTQNGNLADLKTQNTPFFQSASRFQIDPQYAVVFNQKDRIRYNEKYRDIEIYFAVDWEVVKFESQHTITVMPMLGVWYIQFDKLDKLCDAAKLHSYSQRRQDTRGNARSSYVLNLQNQAFKRLI